MANKNKTKKTMTTINTKEHILAQYKNIMQFESHFRCYKKKNLPQKKKPDVKVCPLNTPKAMYMNTIKNG